MGKEAEEKKFEAEEYDALINSIPGGVGIYEIADGEIKVLYSNEAVAQLAGCTKEEYDELTKDDALALICQPEKEKLIEEVIEAITQNKSVDTSYRIKCKDGDLRWNRVCANRMKRTDGRMLLSAVFFDVTEMKKRENILITQQEKLNLALENSDIYIWEYDIVNRLCIQQAKATKDFNAPITIENAPEAVIQLGLVHEESADDYIRIHQRIANGEKEVSEDIHYRDANGNDVWNRIKYVTVFDENNNPIRAVGCGISLEPLKIMEERYQNEMDYRNALKNDNLVVILRVDVTNDKIEDFDIVNHKLSTNYTGNTLSQAIERISSEIPDEKDKKLFLNSFERENLLKYFYSGQTEITIEYRRRFRTGVILWVSTTAKILRNPKTEEVICFFYTYDVDEARIAKEVIKSVVQLDYDYVAYIDGKIDTCILYGSEGKYGLPENIEIAYEESMINYVNKYVIEEEREKMIEDMMLDTVFEKLRKEETYTLFATIQNQRGKISYKTVTYSYMDRNNKKIVLTRRDITEIAKKEQIQRENLKNALLAAEQESHAKSEFLSRMSHEIRTPMNAILGMTTLAAQNVNSPEKVSDYLSKVDMSARFLLSLINDILDMSRIESGKVFIKQEKIPFQEFINGINTICYLQAEEKKVSYESVITSFTEDYYIGDSMKLQQILINVITNAIKFTKEGGKVELIVSQEKINQKEALFRFTINDTGIGISKEFFPDLFEPFAQEFSGSTSSYGGTGLGLAICKNLVSLMNGRISVNTIEGRGTEFVVEVSLGISEETKKKQRNKKDGMLKENLEKKEYDFTGKRVLLVEDHVLNIEVAKRLLQIKNMKVDVAENGLRAIEKFAKAKKGHYQAILMDIRMPIMDGIIATKSIRQMKHPDAKKVPIIAMTANAFEEDIEKTKKAGMNAHLTKPIDPEVLYQKLTEFM